MTNLLISFQQGHTNPVVYI